MGASRSRRAPPSRSPGHEVAGLTRSNRSLGVNLSLWRTATQLGIFEDITCASGTLTARKSWKARFWTIAVAAVQTTVTITSSVRGLGVTAYGMASAAVASRAVFAVFFKLAIFLSRGRQKTVLIVPAKVSRKCKRKCFAIPLFSSNRKPKAEAYPYYKRIINKPKPNQKWFANPLNSAVSPSGLGPLVFKLQADLKRFFFYAP
jgi:hypothetical protein